MLAPVYLFVYNRPFHTDRVLHFLSRNSLAPKSDIYVIQDGFAGLGDNEYKKWLSVVDVVDKYKSKFNKLTVYTRAQNLGCNKSMLEGITTAFESHKAVIILEDDLVVSEKFLEYMNCALKRFENTIVGCINAFNYRIKGLPDYYFIKGTSPMGWATWRNKWQLYNYNTHELIQQLLERRDKRDWDFGTGLSPLIRHAESMMNGGKDTVWSTSLFVNDHISLWPKISFVNHIGFDGSGTHTKSNTRNCRMEEAQYSIESLNNTFDKTDFDNMDLQVDRRALRKMRHFYFGLANKPFTLKEKLVGSYYLFKHHIKMCVFKYKSLG